MSVVTRWRRNVAVLVVTGEVDVLSAHELDREVTRVLSTPPPIVTCDLRHLDFIDVVGAAPLHRLVVDGRAAGSSVYLVYPRPAVARALTLLGVGSAIVNAERLPEIAREVLTH